ncbi:MAG: WYL domain-containing protein [Kiritimatiellaceae bacterium]|nr:WYL domain-containing protein [Kiritimatiellaceae bacterium]
MKRSKTQAERLLDLDRRLRNGESPNCTSFAAEWEISTKTAQRDFDFLRDRMGAPLEYDALKRGYFYSEPTFMMPAVQLNEGELVALLIGSKALEQFQGTPMAEKLTAVFDKLSALLPDNITVRPEELFTRFSFTAPPAMPISSKVWTAVVQALETRQMIEIQYRNWSGEKTARVAPVHLANLQGDWYLFVQYDGFDNFRQLALARIQTVKLLSKKADIVGSFDPKKELSNTFSRFAGDNKAFQVTVQFHSEIAVSVLERQWHPEQKVKNLKGGGVEISFEAKGDIEIKRWVMAYGRYAKVKSPKWLKDDIAEEVRAMLGNAGSRK